MSAWQGEGLVAMLGKMVNVYTMFYSLDDGTDRRQGWLTKPSDHLAEEIKMD